MKALATIENEIAKLEAMVVELDEEIEALRAAAEVLRKRLKPKKPKAAKGGRTSGSSRRPQRCGLCGKKGHNRKTCPE